MDTDQRHIPFPVPFEADRVLPPIVTYVGGPSCINLPLEDGSWCRVTFEKLDALRVSGGECLPYADGSSPDDPYNWVSTVENSAWLAERYAYEKHYYGDHYNFGSDVGEMIRDYSHYCFQFHDEFVEAIAGGVWFEGSPECLGSANPSPDHPLTDLTPETREGDLEVPGMRCQVWRNPKPTEQLEAEARFCSQKLMQFALELDGETRPGWTLKLRRSQGRLRSDLEDSLGRLAKSIDGIATLSDVEAEVKTWMGEVRERRRAMGKG